MSIEFKSEQGYYISTEKFINNVYKNCEDSPKINPSLFQIFSPFCPIKADRKVKTTLEGSSEVANENEQFAESTHDKEFVKQSYQDFRQSLSTQCILPGKAEIRKNTGALQTADYVYLQSGKFLIENSFGSNLGPSIIKTFNGSKFLFPENATFFSRDVIEIEHYLPERKFDLIVLDPPWYNKYIKRKRKKNSAAYNMMPNESLKNIPIENLLNENGIVVVWCTNCQNHIDYLKENIFPEWKLTFAAKWYWVKVTRSGEPICNFSKPPGKQPFEQIVIATKNSKDIRVPDKKIIVSIPSAIHSHKPPLVDVFQQFLPENAQCLEIFARYLLPNWTSYGNEVLRFQHESLYVFEKSELK